MSPFARLVRTAVLTLWVSTALLLAQQKVLPAIDDTTFALRHTHWAWQPLLQTTPPGAASGNAVDAFVDQKLAAAGLQRSPPAAPSVLLRRVWFDLVGLPPPPEALHRFVADASPAAFEREVDALLASPHFGERWARHWLDLVRYAETLGHEYDFPLPNAWRYRDYVIRALNDDVPYDQFVREHIAGDLLPSPRRSANGDNESVQATAAWWFVEQTHSPVDPVQHQADRIDNQIDVVGKALLGLTIACARCHDHKFDAIRSADYYALYGFVKSSRYVQAPLRPVDPSGPDYRAALQAQRTLATTWADAATGEPWQRLRATAPVHWQPAGDVESGRQGDTPLFSASQPARGWMWTNDGFGTEPWLGPFCPDPAAKEPRLLLLPGPFWLSAAAGAQRDGVLQTETFTLAQRYVHVRVAGENSRVNIVVDGLNLVRDPIYGELHRAVNDAAPHWLTFDVAAWIDHPACLQCIDQRAQDLADADHERSLYPENGWLAVQSVVLSDHAEPPHHAEFVPLPVPGWTSPPEPVADALRALVDAAGRLPVSPTIPSLGDGTSADESVFVRGDHRRRGALAKRRFLTALAGDASMTIDRGSGRLQLAEALLLPDNPLPARVLVNRLWHHLFGRGLVRSVDNLGALGDAPSHPELLDWLARDFQQHGWSIKHTLRLLVTSATYQQASRQRDDAESLDAENLLLHRQNVRRLEAEAVRDSLLAISGRLVPTLFGPSIELPHEAQIEARGRPKRSGPIDGAGRRSIYLAMRRNFMPPMLLAFDLPTPFATVGARNVSNVPAQALALANDRFVHAMCARVANHVLDEAAPNQPARLTLAYECALARQPDAAEQRVCGEFLAAAASANSCSVDDPQPWVELVHALVNTTEFSYRR